jgi:hypothetical protein
LVPDATLCRAEDPFAMLEGLQHPSQIPSNPPRGGPSPAFDITSLYNDPTPAPQAAPAPSNDPFGLGGSEAPSSTSAYDFGLPSTGKIMQCRKK